MSLGDETGGCSISRTLNTSPFHSGNILRKNNNVHRMLQQFNAEISLTISKSKSGVGRSWQFIDGVFNGSIPKLCSSVVKASPWGGESLNYILD